MSKSQTRNGKTYEARGEMEEFLGLDDGLGPLFDFFELLDAVFENSDFLFERRGGHLVRMANCLVC